ncbi:MAG: trypsin-like peptidase domain-containing protein [Oscillospiraceae bacterium]|nr:trypsin-like peptidase domain-containing protein [Oscillospiraceae bacterium]
MEPFENNDFENGQAPIVPEEPQTMPPQPEPQPIAYHGAGTGRKESPYANSPYERVEPPRQEYVYRPQTEPPVKKPKKTRKPLWKGLLAGALAVLLVAGSCAATAAVMDEHYEDNMDRIHDYYDGQIHDLQEQIDSLSKGNAAFTRPTDGSAMTPAQLYATSVNSVVAISTTVQANTIYGPTQGSSSGSGFILTEDGYVITNYHVVENATAIQVITHDGTEYAATLVGSDSTNDLAVLKVDATGLAAAPLGSSTDLMIGDMVVAIGNPLGNLASTQTVGYVSGIDREVSTDKLTTISMIQTDAAINPGNSGGPLFNMRGEVIGITTAKYSGTTGSGATIEGIGFAIPIDDVAPLIEDLISHGYVTGAYMGVTVTNTDETAAAKFGLPTGAYIDGVEEGGAAQKTGILPKDIVIAIDEYTVSNVTDLTRALRHYKAGDTATVTLLRGGKEMKLSITFDERPHTSAASSDIPEQQGEMPQSGDFGELYEYFRRYFGG